MWPRLSLPTLVFEAAQVTPDRLALTSVGQGSLTWRQLRDGALAWGSWLRSHAVASGDRVVTLTGQSLEANLVWLGCSAVGAVDVSVNTEFRGDWLRHALTISNARVAIIAERYLEPTLAVVGDTQIETLLVFDGDPRTADLPRRSPRVVYGGPGDSERLPDDPPEVRLSDIACILYTSGTTGRSKAVELPWRQLLAMCQTEPPMADPTSEVFYAPYAPCHLSGRGALYRSALVGGRAVIRGAFSTREFWQDVKEHGCTWALLYAAPTRFLLRVPPRPGDAENPLRRVLMCPLLHEADEFKERFGVEAYSTYGLTEACSPLVVAVEDARSANVGSCGVPMEGVEARVVDADDYPVETGKPGEMVFRSDEPWMFMSAYQGDPEATARIWRNGWLHTGDIFEQRKDGKYYYVDRLKDMIRRRGENISSAELEAAVLRSAAVAEVAAVGVPSAFGDEEVLIAVVPREGAEIEPSQLLAEMREVVPRFAVPRYVRVVESLPKTQATGRVQKQQLRKEGVAVGTWDAQNHA